MNFGGGGESCTHRFTAYETVEPLLLHLRIPLTGVEPATTKF